MNMGELLIRLSIWITLAGYFIGAALLSFSRKKPNLEPKARLAWTIACLALLIHVALAYHFYHHWSQDSAYRETARQTAEVTGLEWGGGVYINYVLIACWVLDVVWWWRRGLESYRSRSAILTVIWQAFLIFMIFNATVVFKTGTLRYIGLILCFFLCSLWWYSGAASKPDKVI